MTARSRRRKARKVPSGVIDASLLAYWEKRAMSPAAWFQSAQVLKACAEFIGKPFTEDLRRRPPPGTRVTADVPPMLFGSVFHMLAGYVIEALLKGILVARHRSAVTGAQLPTWLTHHNLEAHLKKARVVLEGELLQFVRRANVAVVWAGRYPVPKDPAEMGVTMSSSSDLEWFQEIYERLAAVLENGIPDRRKAE